ncbi:MAG: hypothetical protein WD077_08455 [Bacteroidia bacterium]
MLRKIKQQLINLPGWRTSRKIIVLESDDWGAIRSKSLAAIDALRKKGVAVDKCHYMLNDALASTQDLTLLFDLLLHYKDKNGRPPVITANSLVANPDFEKIREGGFQEYFFEPVQATLQSYPEHSQAFDLWKKGMADKIFHPQSHGREHLNISRWMRDLRNGEAEAHLAFDLGMFGISAHISKMKRGSYLAAFDGSQDEIIINRGEVVKEGLTMFRDFFGYPSRSFIAPNYLWDDEIEISAASQGVQYFQGAMTQRLPSSHEEKVKVKRHYQGQKNSQGSRYLVRNVKFEPSSNPARDWVDIAMAGIASAFKWHKPAIVETHRVNFIGFINPTNRETNLRLFDSLLIRILSTWPDVEFMTSDQLGDLMNGNKER